MAVTTYHTSPTPYGKILPSNYVPGAKIKVNVFLHGIGEGADRKSLQACVDFHYWLKKAADDKNEMWLVPQDSGTSLFDDTEVAKLIPIIDEYWDGTGIVLAGLSRGGGATLSIYCSNSLINPYVKGYLCICPANWEGLDERFIAADNKPLWIFAGGRDAAVDIDRTVNTVDDIIRAGRKDNFYFSVFPTADHYIWDRIMNALDTPPINPSTGAVSWTGKNTVGGQEINITVPCVNNPAVSVYDFYDLQKLNDYKPLPLSTAAPAPVPVPAPATVIPFREFIQTGPSTYKITWANGDTEIFKIPTGDSIKEQYCRPSSTSGKYYLKVTTVNGIVKLFDRKR